MANLINVIYIFFIFLASIYEDAKSHDASIQKTRNNESKILDNFEINANLDSSIVKFANKIICLTEENFEKNEKIIDEKKLISNGNNSEKKNKNSQKDIKNYNIENNLVEDNNLNLDELSEVFEDFLEVKFKDNFSTEQKKEIEKNKIINEKVENNIENIAVHNVIAEKTLDYCGIKNRPETKNIETYIDEKDTNVENNINISFKETNKEKKIEKNNKENFIIEKIYQETDKITNSRSKNINDDQEKNKLEEINQSLNFGNETEINMNNIEKSSNFKEQIVMPESKNQEKKKNGTLDNNIDIKVEEDCPNFESNPNKKIKQISNSEKSIDSQNSESPQKSIIFFKKKIKIIKI